VKLSNDDIKSIMNQDVNNNKKVICLNNKKVFSSIKDATKWCNLKYTSRLSDALCGTSKFAGYDNISGEKLNWMYYEDYIKSNVINKSNLNNEVAFSI
jgi:hypothetical protein